MGDLFSPLEPPPEDAARLVGTLRGNTEGLAAGLEVWCGPVIGWRALGDLMGGGQACVARLKRRVLVSLTFDCGEGPPLRQAAEGEDA
jgi:hypothetical protein